MSKKIDDLLLSLKNTSQSIEFSTKDFRELEKSIKNEEAFIGFLKKIDKTELKNITMSLLKSSGIETYLTRVGDVNLRMAALGKQHSSYVSFEVRHLLDLDSIRDTMENIAILCSRYDTNIIDIKGAIVVKEVPNKRSDVWELLINIKSELDLNICIIPIYALCKISIKGLKFDLNKFNSASNQKSYRSSLEELIQEKINLSENSSLIESSK